MTDKQWMLKFIFTTASLLVCFLALVSIFQRRLIYFPSHEDAAAAGAASFLPLHTDSSQFLGYVRDVPHADNVVIFFHGNGGEAIHRVWIGRAVPETVTVILAEYPGYGAKDGEPTESTIQTAALAVFDYAKKRWAAASVTVVGESLGTGVATFVAAQRSIDRLALISPFTSLVAAAKHHYPYLPVSLLLRDRYVSDENLSGVQVPLHIVHGTDDDIVPYALGKKLFDTYQGAFKELTTLPETGHNDIATAIISSEHAAAFRAFLAGTH